MATETEKIVFVVLSFVSEIDYNFDYEVEAVFDNKEMAELFIKLVKAEKMKTGSLRSTDLKIEKYPLNPKSYFSTPI